MLFFYYNKKNINDLLYAFTVSKYKKVQENVYLTAVLLLLLLLLLIEVVAAPEPEPVPVVEKAVRSRGKTPVTVRTSSRRQTKVRNTVDWFLHQLRDNC